VLQTGTYAMPLTFPSTSSYMTISDASSIKDNLHIKLEFRAYDNDKLLVSTKLTDSGYFYLRISPDGYIEFELKPSTNKYIIKEIAKGGELESCEVIFHPEFIICTLQTSL